MNTRKGLAVLGSTGSIGVNTLDVVATHPDKFDVVTLAAHSNLDLIEQQARRFRPRLAVLYDAEKAALLERRLQGLDIEVDGGLEGLCRAATYNGVELVDVSRGGRYWTLTHHPGCRSRHQRRLGQQRDPGHGRRTGHPP